MILRKFRHYLMASFEERLLALADADTLKKAKTLLKQHTLLGVWRQNDGRLCGTFRENGAPAATVTLTTGNETVSVCSVCRQEKVCAHGLALLMYGGRFHAFDSTAEMPPAYSKALLKQDLPVLAGRGMVNSAHLRLTAEENCLHAPSKFESLTLSVKLVTPQREYTGNLSNLRQLYFEKSLSVVVKFDHFSLHDQQIIRFLALNGEAVNSSISLSAELTAELFHALPGFKRFFCNGKNIIVRPERATPALVRCGSKVLPGLLIGKAVLPFAGARLITGRSGYWVGKNDEYFFIGGECEAGFLRSFFRAAPQDRNSITAFPLPTVDADAAELPELPAEIRLDVDFSGGNITFIPEYIYRVNGTPVMFPPKSGRVIAGARGCFRRDQAAEWEFEKTLAMFGFTMDEHGNATANSTEQAGVFLNCLMPELLRSATPPGLSGKLAAMLDGESGLPEVSLHCNLTGRNGDDYILQYSLAGRKRELDWERCVLLSRERKDYIFSGERLFVISPALGKFLRAAGVMLKNVDPAARSFELPRCNISYFRALAKDIPGALPPELFADDAAAGSDFWEKSFHFKGTLRNYQQQGVAFMQYLTDRNFNPLLADEMGLGKTVQLLALLASRMSRGGKPSLIVCPASLTVNWEREAHRFVPDLRVAAPREGNERNAILKKPESFDLLVLSYTGARMSKEALRKYNFEFLVLDEAQHIKNPGSENAKNCKSISAAHRVVLSGTPLENSPDDLWSVMDFLQPGMLGTLPSFRRRYAGITADEELQQELAHRTAPFIKRRTKAEVASDLPEKSERTIFCDPSPDQSRLYDELLESGRTTLKNGSAADIFSLLLRLRQVCCHPGLLPDGRGENIASGKTELLFEVLNEIIDSGHKVLLFSQFTSMLQLLIPELQQRNIPFEYLDGSTRDRQARVDRFNNDPDIPLFLLSLKAGGTGLNLTSADTVILYDPWWNPAVELQAADRTHRIGQTRPVSTVKLVMRDSVEEKVLLLQDKKRKLFNALVENPAAGGGLSLDDLRALFD